MPLLPGPFDHRTGFVQQTSLDDKWLKVPFLDLDFRANVGPSPFAGQIQTSQNPGFQFFPGVLGEGKIGSYFRISIPYLGQVSNAG